MNSEFWFIVGSVEFYGEETLSDVRKHAREMVDFGMIIISSIIQSN